MSATTTLVCIVEVDCSAPQVVGHTIQEQGINSACAEQVFRIDVGMSKGCGNGEPEVILLDLPAPSNAGCLQIQGWESCSIMLCV